jgi:anthranilate synthase component II
VRVVLVDFYDSFTFNLSHYFEQLNVDVTVIRHDYLKLDELNDYDAIILSPGPGLPSEKENLDKLLQQCVGVKPILGVCLGMQALAEHIGGSLVNQFTVKHGVQELIHVNDHSGLFANLPADFHVGLYHSWKVGGFKAISNGFNCSRCVYVYRTSCKKNYTAFNFIRSLF